jgi:hypothetical protein
MQRKGVVVSCSEKVYIAKLAVLISIQPPTFTTQGPSSFEAPGNPGARFALLQGVLRSLKRTPFSLASCSRVIGMNDPAIN